MSWSGTGVFNRVHNWVSDKLNLINVTASRMDAEFDNFKGGLENCMTRDGQNQATAHLNMGGYKLTNMAPGVSASEAARVDQAYPARKNLIVNSKFDFATYSDGASSLLTGNYPSTNMDRWHEVSPISSLVTSRGSFALGQTDVPDNPRYYMIAAAGTGGNPASFTRLSQVIQDVTRIAGSPTTLTFWAKATSGTPKLAIEYVQYFGTGGTPSSSVTAIGVTLLTLSTTWTKYTVNVTQASITGKTLGTNEDHATILNFWFGAGATFNARTGSIGAQTATFHIANVALTQSPVEYPVIHRSYEEDVLACASFFYKVSLTNNGYAGAVTGFKYTVNFPIPVEPRNVVPQTYHLSGPSVSTNVASWTITATGGRFLDFRTIPTAIGSYALEGVKIAVYNDAIVLP